jgi:hypothetical protein
MMATAAGQNVLAARGRTRCLAVIIPLAKMQILGRGVA